MRLELLHKEGTVGSEDCQTLHDRSAPFIDPAVAAQIDARADSPRRTATVQLIGGAPDGDPSRGEIAIEQHFATERMNSHRGT
jgi:hypothetical protein